MVLIWFSQISKDSFVSKPLLKVKNRDLPDGHTIYNIVEFFLGVPSFLGYVFNLYIEVCTIHKSYDT